MSEKTIVITDPTDPSNPYVYDRSRRENFYFTTVIPGGDDTLGFNPPCSDASSLGFPKKGSKVEVFVDDDIVPAWIGFLDDVDKSYEDRVLKNVSFTAKGYQYSADFQKFRTSVTFGPAASGSSPLTDKVVITDISDAMIYALSQKCPDINIDLDQIATTGININADSQVFSGQGAIQVFNFFAALTAYLSTPMVWEVYPDPDVQLPTFRFWTVDTSTSYWDNGKSKQQLKHNFTNIINEVTVQWGNQQKWTEPIDSGGSIYYGPMEGISSIHDKYVTLQAEYQGLDDIKALALGYLAAFNVDRASGSIVLTEDPRFLDIYSSTIDICKLRAGRIIEAELPDDESTGPGVDSNEAHYIVATRWEEGNADTCPTMSLTVGEIGGIYSEIRRLQALPNGSITWAIDFATFGFALPDADKYPLLGTEYPDRPDIVGSPMVQAVVPMAAISNGTNTYGDKGGQILPDILPTRKMGPMMVFRATSGTVPVANDLARGSCLDWKDLNVYQIISKESATIQVVVKINGVTKVTCNLTAGTNTGLVSFSPAFTTLEGDVVTYDITANDNSTDFSVMVFGAADHPTFPNYPAVTP